MFAMSRRFHVLPTFCLPPQIIHNPFVSVLLIFLPSLCCTQKSEKSHNPKSFASSYDPTLYTYLHSTTMTSKLVDAVFPAPSLKVYVTVVVPMVKNEPGACDLESRKTTPELSVAVGSVKDTVVPPEPNGTCRKMSPIPFTTGGTLSTEKKEKLKILCELASLLWIDEL